MSGDDEETDDSDNGSKMKAMKAIMNYADDQENDGMRSKSSNGESSRVSKEGGLGAADFDDGMDDGATGDGSNSDDEPKKKKGGSGGGGGLGLDKIMGMFK